MAPSHSLLSTPSGSLVESDSSSLLQPLGNTFGSGREQNSAGLGWPEWKRRRTVIQSTTGSLLTSNLVSHSLGLNDSDVIDDSLVEVEILGKPICSRAR